MIVDCHMHVWRYPDHFNKEVMLGNQPRRRRDWPDERFKSMWDNPAKRYLDTMEGVVEKAVILGLKAGKTLGIDTPNEYLAEIARQYPDKFAWCCCVIPIEEDAPSEIEHCVKDLGAIGVGELCPAHAGYYANDQRCYPTYEVCQNLEVPIMIHAGAARPRQSRLKYGDLLAIDDLAIDFPNLKIVIAHMGYYDYETASFLVQKHENVFADISWLPAISGFEGTTLPRYLPVVRYPYLHYAYPLLYHLTETFGHTDKLLWGTDWPSSPPENSIKILLDINNYLSSQNLPVIPENTIERMLRENWKQVFSRL